MSIKKCLLCYDKVGNGEKEFHASCSRKLFSKSEPPPVNTTLKEIEDLAQTHAKLRVAVAGVQPKLSIDLKPSRAFLSIHKGMQVPRISVGIRGQYLLKAPIERFPEIVEIEDLTMHLARVFGIVTAPHGLVRLQSGELAYMTRRFDRLPSRSGVTKLAQEDFCQLSGLLTENKYNSSMEKVGRLVRQYSMNPGFDAIVFFEIALFSFLTGNADMHTKNFSLLTAKNGVRGLSPAYDLVATKFLTPEDTEESALSINGKKRKLKRTDFVALGLHLEIPEKVLEKTIEKFEKIPDKATDLIEKSFLSEKLKVEYEKLLFDRAERLRSVSKNQ